MHRAHAAFADEAGADEDGDHDRDFFLLGEVVEGGDEARVGVATGVALAVLDDEEGGGGLGVVLGGDVDPVVADHAGVDLARVHDFLGEFALGDAGLFVGVGSERGEVGWWFGFAVDGDGVVVAGSGGEFGEREPEVGAFDAGEFGAGGIINGQSGQGFGFGGEEEVALEAGEAAAVLDDFREGGLELG